MKAFYPNIYSFVTESHVVQLTSACLYYSFKEYQCFWNVVTHSIIWQNLSLQPKIDIFPF